MVFKLSEVLTRLSKREGNTVNLFFFFCKVGNVFIVET